MVECGDLHIQQNDLPHTHCHPTDRPKLHSKHRLGRARHRSQPGFSELVGCSSKRWCVSSGETCKKQAPHVPLAHSCNQPPNPMCAVQIWKLTLLAPTLYPPEQCVLFPASARVPLQLHGPTFQTPALVLTVPDHCSSILVHRPPIFGQR